MNHFSLIFDDQIIKCYETESKIALLSEIEKAFSVSKEQLPYVQLSYKSANSKATNSKADGNYKG